MHERDRDAFAEIPRRRPASERTVADHSVCTEAPVQRKRRVAGKKISRVRARASL